MHAYDGHHIAIDLTIKVWRIPIRIKGTIEPLAIAKLFGEPEQKRFIKPPRSLSLR